MSYHLHWNFSFNPKIRQSTVLLNFDIEILLESILKRTEIFLWGGIRGSAIRIEK